MQRRFALWTTAAACAAVTAVAVSIGPGLPRACAAETEAVSLLSGKDLSGWKAKAPESRSNWTVGRASVSPSAPGALVVEAGGSDLVNAKGGGVDLSTEQKFGDALIEVEVMVPKGSNSGIYVMGEYEVQVFDSFGKSRLGQGDMGAIYSAAAPKTNASKAPGTWQKFEIDFRAPKFDADGKKTANARFVKVTLNGTVLHEDVEVKAATPGGLTGREAATGPIMLQGDHGAVAYRNIKVTPRGK
jgi:hypothetical protein